MSCKMMTKLETGVSAYFLPPNIDPKYCRYTRYINQPPFIRAASGADAFEKVKRYFPTAILRNVLIQFSIDRKERRPEGNMCTVTEATNFSHPEVTVEQFSELVKCCHSDEADSLEGVKKCWNRVLPGNLSDFNLNVTSKDDLNPLVRKNLDKFYPSKL